MGYEEVLRRIEEARESKVVFGSGDALISNRCSRDSRT